VASDYYIESLRIESVGDKVNEAHPDMRHDYVAAPSEYLEVGTMLTSRNSGASGFINANGHRNYGKNARASVVLAANWVGGYMGRADVESIPISGVLMEQLRERYGTPRPRYQMTVSGNINPFAAVVFGGRGYTVEGYERDLYNDTTNITID
jgi:hypothetical protein